MRVFLGAGSPVEGRTEGKDSAAERRAKYGHAGENAELQLSSRRMRAAQPKYFNCDSNRLLTDMHTRTLARPPSSLASMPLCVTSLHCASEVTMVYLQHQHPFASVTRSRVSHAAYTEHRLRVCVWRVERVRQLSVGKGDDSYCGLSLHTFVL